MCADNAAPSHRAAAGAEFEDGISFKGDLNVVIAESEKPFVMTGDIDYNNIGNLHLTLNSDKDNKVLSLSVYGNLTITGNGKLLLNSDQEEDYAVYVDKDFDFTVSGTSVTDTTGKQAVFANGTCSFFSNATTLVVDGKAISKTDMPAAGGAQYYYMSGDGWTKASNETEIADSPIKLEVLSSANGVDSRYRLTLNGVTPASDGFLITRLSNVTSTVGLIKAGIYCDGDLDLVLMGENTIQPNASESYGVYTDGSLTVSGTGSLTVKQSGEDSIYADQNLTVNRGTITIDNSGYNGLRAYNGTDRQRRHSHRQRGVWSECRRRHDHQ